MDPQLVSHNPHIFRSAGVQSNDLLVSYMLCEAGTVLVASVCLSVSVRVSACLSSRKPNKLLPEIDVTWYEYVSPFNNPRTNYILATSDLDL